MSHGIIFFSNLPTLFAQACLGILLRLDDSVARINAVNTPLAKYASRYWADHARFENVSSRIREATEILFDVDKPYWCWNICARESCHERAGLSLGRKRLYWGC